MEKIRFQEGDIVETLWGEKIEDNVYRVKNLPFHIYGISYDDQIETERVDGQLQFKSVLKKSGHSTYRVFVNDSVRFQESWKPIEELGCSYEQAVKSLYSIDVPSTANVKAVYGLLQKAEDEKVWVFEEANFEEQYKVIHTVFSNNMNKAQFYKLNYVFKRADSQYVMQMADGDIFYKENGLIPENALSIGDFNKIQLPALFRHQSGNRMNDIISTGTVGLVLISDRVKKIFEKNNLTGWKVFPILLKSEKDEVIPGYHGLSITGRYNIIEFDKARLVKAGDARAMSNYYKGIDIDINKWDGTDFFISRGSFFSFVSSKAAEVIKKEKIGNIEITNCSDIEILERIADSYNENLERNLKIIL